MKTKKRSSPKLEGFFSPNSSEDQKNKVFTKIERLFSQNSSEDQRSDADQSQVIGGDADVYHTQIIGGIQSNYWGRYIPPGFGTPACTGAYLGGIGPWPPTLGRQGRIIA